MTTPTPYLRENPLLPAMPARWDHIPSLRELRLYRSAAVPSEPFPVYPGVDYLWVLAKNRNLAMEAGGWTTLRGVDMFTIGEHPVVLMGRGAPIAEATLETSEPVLWVDPELFTAMNPTQAVPPPIANAERPKREQR